MFDKPYTSQATKSYQVKNSPNQTATTAWFICAIHLINLTLLKHKILKLKVCLVIVNFLIKL